MIPEDQTLIIRSRFAKLEPKTLLLGHTSKAGSDKIGSFGEGYKIALLVLTRCGYEVQVRNGDRLWRPKFMYSHTFESDVLCIEDSAAQSRTEGVEFVVSGLTLSEFVEIRNQCRHILAKLSTGGTSQGSIGTTTRQLFSPPSVVFS